MSQISLQADETYMDERLDKFLSAMLPDQSRSYLQKIIKDGNVLVNGERNPVTGWNTEMK